MSNLVIPGVSIRVVKDVVTPQLSPSGVLGLVGLVERGSATGRAASWNAFVGAFGLGSAYSLADARQALENGVTELVVVPVDAGTASSAKVSLDAPGRPNEPVLTLGARAPGPWANDLRVISSLRRRGDEIVSFDLEIQNSQGEVLERHPRLQMLPGFPRSVETVLNEQSARLRVNGSVTLSVNVVDKAVADGDAAVVLVGAGVHQALALYAIPGGPKLEVSLSASHELTVRKEGKLGWETVLQRSFSLPAQIGALVAAVEELGIVDVVLAPWPAGDGALSGGTDASLEAYKDAINKLAEQPDVDLVIAAVQDQSDERMRRGVYSAVIAHCERMASDAKGRVGFGEVLAGASAGAATAFGESLRSDRFVLVAPQGLLGAVAGRVGSLAYFESPTFKTLAGVGAPSRALTHEEQTQLLQGALVPVVVERGRGLVVVKGITTDADQISVRRVADRAVRGVKVIGDQFIGRLNNVEGRAALRQKLHELLLRMEKEGALVPSTDGTSPAFSVDVYSTQLDFEQGIVQVEIAVRPVRAIDYIYTTLRVQV